MPVVATLPDSGGRSRFARTLGWVLALALAALLHVSALLLRVPWLTERPTLPPRVDITRLDPAKLEAIRKRWREREEPKALLLDKDPSAKSAEEAPENAKYFSSKNIRVEKEQRARETAILPKAGAPGQAAGGGRASERVGTSKSSGSRVKRPALADLGLAYRLGRPAGESATPGASSGARAAGGGGDQAILDRDLPQGSENLLNAQESVYYSFYSRLYEAIGPVWQSMIREIPQKRRVLPGEYQTLVDVVLDSQGNLVSVHHAQDSGIAEFDSAVDRAWERVARFPNPPKGLLDEKGQVHTGWTFSVHIGEGFRMQFVPPERNY